MADLDLKLSGQCGDPEIVRENFNKIMRLINGTNSYVVRLQSEVGDYTSLGINNPVRTFTVFLQSDTDICYINIPDPRIFADAEINKNNTLWIVKTISGANGSAILVNNGTGGTLEGSPGLSLSNGQTVMFQSNGEEYKILFNSVTSTLFKTNSVNNSDQSILDVIDSATIQAEYIGAGQYRLNNIGSSSHSYADRLEAAGAGVNAFTYGGFGNTVTYSIFVDSTAGDMEIHLPLPNTFASGILSGNVDIPIVIIIGDNGANPKSFDIVSPGTINGSSTPIIFVNGETYMLQSNGIEWKIINHFGP